MATSISSACSLVEDDLADLVGTLAPANGATQAAGAYPRYGPRVLVGRILKGYRLVPDYQ